MTYSITRRALLPLVAALVLPAQLALAQADYPSKQVTIVVPFPPGGSTDVTARLIADKLSAKFGKPFVVENRAGGAGIVGTGQVAHSPPDGYTLLVGANGAITFNVLTKKEMPFQNSELAPVIRMTDAPQVLGVRKDLPVKDFKEFVAYAKANPGKLNFGNPGVGGGNHLSVALIEQVAGIKATLVPYQGEADISQALVGGVVDFAVLSSGAMASLGKSGAVKLLAVGSEKRWPDLPDVPTLKELGYDVTLVSAWLNMLAPAGTPQPIIDKLNAAVNEALQDKSVHDKLRGLGVEVVGGSAKEFGQFWQAEMVKWEKVVKDVGLYHTLP